MGRHGKRTRLASEGAEEKAASSGSSSKKPQKKKARLEKKDASLRQSSSFAELGCVPSSLVSALGLLGFSHCTPVQEATLPLLLPPMRNKSINFQTRNGTDFSGFTRDIAVEAPTGSGKTLAFLVPTVCRLASRLLEETSLEALHAWRASLAEGGDRQGLVTQALLGLDQQQGPCRLGAVVLSPTRELCFQICAVLEKLLRSLEASLDKGGAEGVSRRALRIRALRLTGGTPSQQDAASSLAALMHRASHEAIHVLCATPGRLECVLASAEMRKKEEDALVKWETLDLFVVDEADRLLDEQHATQLGEIHAALKRLREMQLLPQDRRRQPRLQVALFSATLSEVLQQRTLRGILKEPFCVRVSASNKTAHTAASPGSSALPQEGEEQGQEKQGQEKQGQEEPASQAAVQHCVPQTLTNAVLSIEYEEKIPFLFNFITKVVLPRKHRCIVFCLTCQYVEYLFALLSELLGRQDATQMEGKGGAPLLRVEGRGCLEKLHGKMKQRARWAALKRFNPTLREAQGPTPASEACVLLATDVAARGLDFPEVDYILQLDPPQNPEVFVHRVGRTARAGRGGTALLLLLPHEDAFETFLNNRGVSLVHFKELPEAALVHFNNEQNCAASKEENHSLSKAEEVNSSLMKAVEEDQALIVKGSRAFVSYVRAYKEHKLAFLLPFSRLDLGRLATALRLLRLPRVREVKGRSFPNFTQSPVDPASVPFKHDPAREKERLENLEGLLAKRQEQQREREKRQRREDKFRGKGITRKQKRTRSEKREAKKRNTLDEWKELAFEERLARKLRRGRISEAQYEAALEKGPLAERGEAVSGYESDDSDSMDSDEDSASQMNASKKSAASNPTSANERGRRRPSWAARRKGSKKRR